MTTIEDLESNVDWIMNRYKDIDKEKENRIKENKKENKVITFFAPVVVLIAVFAFLIGAICGMGI